LVINFPQNQAIVIEIKCVDQSFNFAHYALISRILEFCNQQSAICNLQSAIFNSVTFLEFSVILPHAINKSLCTFFQFRLPAILE
jgi:hypothetical protein